jgi:hypothetical protein
VELVSSTAFPFLVDESSTSKGRHSRKLAGYGHQEVDGDDVESVYSECRPLPCGLLGETKQKYVEVSQQAGSVVSYEAIIEDYLRDSNPATTGARLRSQHVHGREVSGALSTSSYPVDPRQACSAACIQNQLDCVMRQLQALTDILHDHHRDGDGSRNGRIGFICTDPEGAARPVLYEHATSQRLQHEAMY